MLVVANDPEQLDPGSVDPLEHEYALRDVLDADWAAKPLALTREHGRSVLALSDPGGRRLSELLDGRWETARFLQVGIGMAVALGQVHARGLIHKDVKPAHFLVDPASGAAWLTGFGISSRLVRERQAPEAPETIAGTLAYMAPEQTGRMNRSVDARSDLYALGITFYQMLTGELPFTATAPMELVHCHIAHQPVPPDQRDARIPAALSAIVLRLLAKTAEDRYQTAAGVASDLRDCLAQWKTNGCIEAFPLGANDRPDSLLVPERLYGRQREIHELLESFARVVQGSPPELVLVSGYAGIGKSSVVSELQKALIPSRGLFASGKFDQYKRDVPYSTLAQAFRILVRELLAKSDADLAPWRDALRTALGSNGRLVTDLVPDLALIIGEQPSVPELPLQDAHGRFRSVLRRFIGVFARPEHPLALFLDDLQWVDAATLEFVEDLLTRSELRYLQIVGAYRDHEVTPVHPLMRMLDTIGTDGAVVHHFVLSPLGREDLSLLVADSLRTIPENSAPLAQLVHEKTGGNPFFAIQFLYALAEERLLTFDHTAARWSWDIARIHDKGYTDNVVDLMVEKLERLPPDTLQALRNLACLGYSTDIATLEMMDEGSSQDLRAHLQEALRSGLVLSSRGTYRFLHDRVQEAAYRLIPARTRAETHLRIGRLLSRNASKSRLEESIFDIVNQFNRGADLITSADERERLAELNLIAGRRAMASAAYASALNYLVAGKEQLASDAWLRRHDLAFALELHQVECEFLTGALAASEKRATMLASRARSTIERATVECLRIDLYTALDRTECAVSACLAYLRHIGVEWSPHPTEMEARREYERIWSQLRGRAIEELLELPLMNDPATLATLDVLTKIFPTAMFTDANLLCMAVSRVINLSLEFGHSDGSCVAYVYFGKISGPCFGNYEAGARFGQLGYDLVETRRLERFQARTYLWFAKFVVPWTKHVKVCRGLMRRAFEAATRVGDLNLAVYSFDNLNTNFFAAGDPLPEAQRQAETGLEFARKTRFGHQIDIIGTQLGLIKTLRGLTDRFGILDDGQFKEAIVEQHDTPNPAVYWIMKLQARFFAGDHAAALEAAAKAAPKLWTLAAMFETAEYHFYTALSHAACARAAPAAHRSEHVDALFAHELQLTEWARHCPDNFQNRAALVRAEIARLEGREIDAELLYDEAIRSARENEFIHNEALACELAAHFYLARGLDDIGVLFLRKARRCYVRWGASAKVRQLDETYAGILEEETYFQSSALKASTEELDLATVIKVGQVLSSEIVLEKMIDTLMRTAIQHAGAGRGLLILARPSGSWVAAEATSDRGTVDVRMLSQSVAAGNLPQSVFHYVLRTRQSVILDDAAARGPFVSDAYIREREARSILCLPLLKQTTLVGMLYLENPLAARAFTPARIAILDLIASQAAIALENARLYADLQKAQRLESMGTLAGGIAHDFNNILGAILGYGEMALRGARTGTQLRRDVEAIITAGERGRSLVERVLAFSRSGVAERVPVHVEKVVREAIGLLGAQWSDAIRFDVGLAAGQAALLGDATQIHQVVMNLCTNAAQAMPKGGVVSVALHLERFEAARSFVIGAVGSGDYIVLKVSDTGIGIPAHIVERIFDPFFTTKETGSGTGLGLSLVHGIVTQLGGAIDVASAPGKGTTLIVYLPRSGDAPSLGGDVDPALPRGEGQRVLVVDDEEPIARLAVRILEELGYAPVSFASGAAALAAVRDDPERFDAMITDERMPGGSGCDLAREVRRLRREMPILLMSGFVDGGLKERARAAGVIEVLQKPLLTHDLANGLARALHR